MNKGLPTKAGWYKAMLSTGKLKEVYFNGKRFETLFTVTGWYENN